MKNKITLSSLLIASTLLLSGCNSSTISERDLERKANEHVASKTFSGTFDYHNSPVKYRLTIDDMDFEIDKSTDLHIAGKISIDDERLATDTPIFIDGFTKIKHNKPSGTLFLSGIRATDFDMPAYHSIAFNRIYPNLLESMNGLLHRQLTGLVVADFKSELSVYKENGINLDHYSIRLATKRDKLVITATEKKQFAETSK